MYKVLISTVLVIIFITQSNADTPANCTYEQISGVWTIIEGPRGKDKSIDCFNLNSFKNDASSFNIELLFPNVAIDEQGNKGFWTLIYNQGFEIVINNRKYFSFARYHQDGNETFSQCDQTLGSSSHDIGVDPVNWSCFYGIKFAKSSGKTFYRNNHNLIKTINSQQSQWKATHYDFLENKSLDEIVRLAGGKNSKYVQNPPTFKPSKKSLYESSLLPESFSWKNVNGTDWISPIRDQGSCGSCYAFASMALLEAKYRIQSNMTQQPIFSTQDVVECSKYSQGCDGGFPYLVAGKYAEDYGVVEETCNQYKGVDGKCHFYDKNCTRHYATNYRYIGGFYGGCNEPLMRIALVNNGPLAVSFQVYDDFLNYKSGIYHYTGHKDSENFKYNPWEITNHVVLVVGYGNDNGTDYWLVKNSWGTTWGEQGYFRIRRGNDECSIESIAVEVDAVLNQ